MPAKSAQYNPEDAGKELADLVQLHKTLKAKQASAKSADPAASAAAAAPKAPKKRQTKVVQPEGAVAVAPAAVAPVAAAKPQGIVKEKKPRKLSEWNLFIQQCKGAEKYKAIPPKQRFAAMRQDYAATQSKK